MILSFFADQFQHLGCAALAVTSPVLEILLGKIAVLVQCFTAGQRNVLAGMSRQVHLHITCHILSKVQHGLAVWCFKYSAGKCLMFKDRHRIHAPDGQVVFIGAHTVPACQLSLPAGIVYFSLLHVVLSDRPPLGRLHVGIGDADHLTVHFQLKQHSQGIAEQISSAVYPAGAAMPAIPQGDQKLILPLLQQPGHIIGLGPQLLIPGKAARG